MEHLIYIACLADILLLNILSSFRVLEKLSIKSKTKNELKNSLDTSSSSLAQILSKMVNSGMIEQNGDVFRILPRGEFILKIQKTLDCYEKFLNRFGDYINLYTLEDIPENLVLRFYELNEIEVVERSEDVFLPHREFIEGLSESKEIYGYSTIFFPEYIASF